MTLIIGVSLLEQIHSHGERTYPEEAAGFLLGRIENETRLVEAILPAGNVREDAARRNRYLLNPQAVLAAEDHAEAIGLEILGIFHSHPDHPDRPSEIDREWALPWYTYLITSVINATAVGTRCWRLREDRSAFAEEECRVRSD